MQTLRPEPRLWRAVLSYGAVLLIGMAVTFVVLERTSFNRYRGQLRVTAIAQARVIEAVARFDAAQSSDYPGGAAEATRSQIRDALEQWEGFGKTGELVVASPRPGWQFIATDNQHADRPTPDDAFVSDAMTAAWSGETGTMVCRNRHDVDVLAAYAPLPSLGMGLVVQVEVGEIQRPFYLALVVTAGLGLGLAGLIGWQTRRMWLPVIRTLARDEAHYRLLFESARDPILLVDTDQGIIRQANRAARERFGLDMDATDPLPDIQSLFDDRVDLSVVGETPDHVIVTRTEGDGTHDFALVIQPLPSARAGSLIVAHDVTAERRAAEATAESEQHLRRVLQHAPYPLAVHADDGAIEMVSDEWVRQTGYSRDELTSLENWFRLARSEHTNEDSFLRRAREIHQLESATRHGEFTIRTADGKDRVWSFTSAPLGKAADGRHLAVTMGADVTDLRREQALGRSVIDSLSANVAVVDSTGEILLVNQAWETFGGQEGGAPELRAPGVNYLDVVDQAADSDVYAAKAAEGIRQVLKGEREVFVTEYPCHGPTRNRWFRMVVTPLFGQRGAVIAHEDITRRKLVALEAEHARTLLVRTQAVAGVGGWEVDAATRAVDWTPETFRIHDLDPAATPTPTLQDALSYYPEEHRPTVAGAVQSAITGGRSFDLELPLITATGRRIWIRAIGSAETDDGRVVRVTGTVQDIDRRKRAELALRAERQSLAERVDAQTEELRVANAELQHALRVKDQFLANMSHELRTPLNGVLVLAESLREQVFGPLTDQQKRCVRGIRDSGKHLLNLINDVLDLAKVEAQMLTIEPVPTDVEALCESSVALVRDMANRKGLDLTVRGNNPVKAIRVDERRMKQVLVNLLSNAIKFTDSGSVELDVRRDDQWIEFAVRDTGIGIAEADIRRLFQPFSQLDGSLSRSHEGTGLGLVIVDRLVRLHGGDVTVDSTPGAGTTFTVRLPAATTLLAVENDATLANWPSTNGTRSESIRTGRVLLADDNDLNRQALVDYLHACGYDVLTARDGNDALATALRDAPDLVLLDVQMPGMDGLEVVRRLRAHDPPFRSAVVALTALAMPDDRRRCLDAGCDDYLPKPVSLSSLRRTIDRWLGGPPRLSPGSSPPDADEPADGLTGDG